MFEKITDCESCGHEIMTENQKLALAIVTITVTTVAKIGLKAGFKAYVNSRTDTNTLDA